MTRRYGKLLLVVGALGVMAACSDIFGFKDLTLLDAGVPEAGPNDAGTRDAPIEAPVEASVEAGREAGPEASTEGGCVPAVPPALPTTDDTPDGGDGGVDVVFAVSSLDLGQSSNGSFDPNHPIGFDLDGVCTCFDDGGSSCSGTQVCDTAGGRDESANQMLATLGTEDSNLSQATLNKDIQQGDFGLVIHVLGYNGLADDQTVTVEVFPSPSAVSTPKFDGTDQWNVTTESVAGGNFGDWVSRYQDLNAYVNNHVLVANLSTFPLLVNPDTGTNDNPIVFDLTNVEMQATIAQTGGTWTLQGQVGARWSTSAALLSFDTLAMNGESLCGSNLLYSLLMTSICMQADLQSNPQNDGKGLPCDALSVALGFSASPANLADEITPTVVPGDCPDNWAPACK